MSAYPSKEMRRAGSLSERYAYRLRSELEDGQASPEFLDKINIISRKVNKIGLELVIAINSSMLNSPRLGEREERPILNDFSSVLKGLKAGADNYDALSAAADTFFERIRETKIIKNYPGNRKLLVEIMKLTQPPKVEAQASQESRVPVEVTTEVAATPVVVQESSGFVEPSPEVINKVKQIFTDYIERFSTATVTKRIRSRTGIEQIMLDRSLEMLDRVDTSWHDADTAKEFWNDLTALIKDIFSNNLGLPKADSVKLFPGEELMNACRGLLFSRENS